MFIPHFELGRKIRELAAWLIAWPHRMAGEVVAGRALRSSLGDWPQQWSVVESRLFERFWRNPHRSPSKFVSFAVRQSFSDSADEESLHKTQV